MKTEESRKGPTPNGGVRSTAYFRNDDGDPAPKELATQVEIIEYDGEDRVVGRTYGTLQPGRRGTGEAPWVPLPLES